MQNLTQRRTRRCFSLAGLLLVGALGAGEAFATSSFYVEPPAVSELLAQAALGRVDFIKVTSDMERLAPAMVYPEPMFAYLNALDDLYKLGLDYDMETWGSIPVKGLGYTLTEHALKWFHLGLIEERAVASFIRWAKDDTVHIAISSQMPYLLQINDTQGLLAWHKKVAHVLQLLGQRKVAPYVIETAEQLQGKIVLKLIQKSSDLAPSQIEELIRSLASHSAIQQVAGFIEKKIYATSNKATRSHDLYQLSRWSLLLGEAITEHAELLPEDLYDLSGRLFHELLRKYLFCKETPDLDIFMQEQRVLSDKQLAEFVDLFHNYDWNLLTKSQLDFLQSYARGIQEKLEKLELQEQSLRNKSMLNKFALMKKIMTLGVEGVYQVSVDSYPAVLTILDRGDKSLVASLRINRGSQETPIYQDYTFQDVSYDVDRDLFEFHRVLVEEPRHGVPVHRMYFASLKFSDSVESKNTSGRIKVAGSFALGKHLSGLKGEKTRNFVTKNISSFGSDKSFEDHKIVGEYRGEGLSLSISEAGQKIAAMLVFDSYHLQLRLNFGVFNKDSQRLYLTSGELESDRMVQVRGSFISPDELVISYIVGGQGVLLDSVKLRRM